MKNKLRLLIAVGVVFVLAGVVYVAVGASNNDYFTSNLAANQLDDERGSLSIPDTWTASHSHNTADAFYHDPEFSDADAPAIIRIQDFDDGGLFEDVTDESIRNALLQSIADDMSEGDFFDNATEVSIVDHDGGKAIFAITVEENSVFSQPKKAVNLIGLNDDNRLVRVIAMVNEEDFSTNRERMEEIVYSWQQ